jgi:hypothetical protein
MGTRAAISAAQRRKLDAAIDALRDRDEIATTFDDLLKKGGAR